METSDIQFLGDPSGHHGPYTFYKGIKYHKNGKTQILTIGEFFFVKILRDAGICIAELQLLWQDRNHEDIQLCSARLYFLPEDTPEGRLPHHGEDEVLAEAEKLVLSLDDLLSWVVTDTICWPHGRPVTTTTTDKYCGAGVTTETDELIEAFSANNQGAGFVKEARRIKKDTYASECLRSTQPACTEVIVLSYPQYCRYRAAVRRLPRCASVWLRSALLAAVGGFTASSPDARIHFCRDVMDHPDLEDHESRLDHLAPNLKGRPRKKRNPYRRDWSLDSDSSDSLDQPHGNHSNHGNPASVGRHGDRMIAPGLLAETNNHHKHSYLNHYHTADTKPVKIKEESDRRKDSDIAKPKREGDVVKEKTFLNKLYEFMRKRNSPISRIPTLGFKEIDMYEFYSYCKKLGGYEQITAKRLWKHIYDKMGGNPSNTSAATCTRRHYERLLLPYELHIRGQEHRLAASAGDHHQRAASAGDHHQRAASRSVQNTVRSHLLERTGSGDRSHLLERTGSDPAAATPRDTHTKSAVKLEPSEASKPPVTHKGLLVQNGNKESSTTNPSGHPIIPSTKPTNHKQEPQPATNSLPPFLAAGMLLPPGMTLAPGTILGLPQIPLVTTAGTNGVISIASDKKPAVNGMTKVEPERPSVIQHTTTTRKILNPAPSPRPNIPKTVYGPPDVIPGKEGSGYKRPYQTSQHLNNSTLAKLQPEVFNAGKMAGSPDVKRFRGDDSRPPFRPMDSEIIVLEQDEPTDLSMKTLRRKEQPPPPPPVKTVKNDLEAPLNLSLKAHNTPKTASVCVPKLPVNPFKPVNMSAPIRPEVSPNHRLPHQPHRVDKPPHGTAHSSHRVDKLIHGTAQQPHRVDKPMQGIAPHQQRGDKPVHGISHQPHRVDKPIHGSASGRKEHKVENMLPRAPTNLPVPTQENADHLLQLGLSLVHPAFPHLMPNVLSSTSAALANQQPALSSSALLPPAGMSLPLLGAAGMYLSGLPSYALSAQVYPHLYQPAPPSSSATNATAPASHPRHNGANQ